MRRVLGKICCAFFGCVALVSANLATVQLEAQPVVSKTAGEEWRAEMRQIDGLLLEGKFKKARSRSEALMTVMCESILGGEGAEELLATVVVQRGLARAGVGDDEGAVWDLHAALNLDPQNPFAHAQLGVAHEYLGEAYAEMGKFDLAEKELQILRELGSDEARELEEFIAKMKKQ